MLYAYVYIKSCTRFYNNLIDLTKNIIVKSICLAFSKLEHTVPTYVLTVVKYGKQFIKIFLNIYSKLFKIFSELF